MTIHLSVPARVNLLGNPGDANEGAFGVISAAIDLRAHARIDPHDNHLLEITNTNFPPIEFTPSDLPLPYNGQGDLVKAAINRLFASSAEFQEKINQVGFHLQVWSEVPRQSGLGGSSLFVLLTLAAMRAHYDLDRQAHNDYYLAELAQRVEELELGITCGFADRYVPLFGGLAYLDYHGKLNHTGIGHEPYATYERLEHMADDLHLLAVMTGVRHDSGDVHGRMRPRFLAEHSQWLKTGGEMPPMVSFMSRAWECAWRGKIALLEGDLSRFGRLMDQNHRLVDEMMRYSGFKAGAGWANNLFIQTARENGALGAKLTGAGGGGSVFALLKPGDEERIGAAWRETAAAKDLTQVQIFPLTISSEGLVVEQK